MIIQSCPYRGPRLEAPTRVASCLARLVGSRKDTEGAGFTRALQRLEAAHRRRTALGRARQGPWEGPCGRARLQIADHFLDRSESFV